MHAEFYGVDPMSIYHHIKGKAALLDVICEAVLTEVVAPAPDGAPHDWEEVARRTAHSYRDMAHRHPRVFPLLATRAQTSPVAISALEGLVAAMRAAGLPERVAADAPMVLFGFLNGHLLACTGGGPDGLGLRCPGSTPARTRAWPPSHPGGPTSDLSRSSTGCSTSCSTGSGVRRLARPEREACARRTSALLPTQSVMST